MNRRYTDQVMEDLFSDSTRIATWTEIELLVCEALHAIGEIPEELAAEIAAQDPPSIARVQALEAEVDHEVVAFILALCEGLTVPAASHVHKGLTSSDVVDTYWAVILRRATDILLERMDALLAAARTLSSAHWETWCVGRTHGQAAEPTTFGYRIGRHIFAIQRGRGLLTHAREAISVGTISGAVGTYSTVTRTVEAFVLTRLHLAAEPAPSQIVARDRHSQLVSAISHVATILANVALDLRLMQQTGLAEVREGGSNSRVGSSVMPGKNNPIRLERIEGLARVIRGHSVVASENILTWLERDLTNSAAERLILPESISLLDQQLRDMTEVLANLQVDTERMACSLAEAGSTVLTSAWLVQLLNSGCERSEAYDIASGAAHGDTQMHQLLVHVLERSGRHPDELSDVQRRVLAQISDHRRSITGAS